MSVLAVRPVVLAVLDGWGIAPDGPDNAISMANTPNWDRLQAQYPHSQLATSGLAVGLPDGQMGNSEVGHMNIGAGRVVMQDLPRIDAAIADGSLATLPELVAFRDTLKQSGGVCHLLGLLSPGGVHAHHRHMLEMARILDEAGIPVRIHAFLDGRDTPPSSALEFLAEVQPVVDGLTNVQIATVCGRYYAMDRDQRWDRVRLAYDGMVSAKGAAFPTGAKAVEASYAEGITDEFVKPAVIGGYTGMRDGDGVLMANFRADRAREILAVLLDPDFDGFEVSGRPSFAAAMGMVEYSSQHAVWMEALFPPEQLTDILGEVVSKAGLTQLRIAETEKYAHVTFFFNGGREEPFAGEERILIPSPKVATYDQQPEMSAPEVTDKLVDAIEQRKFDVLIVNYANTDMVGHTGDKQAAIQAVEAVDQCLGRVVAAVEKVGGAMLITADHGNAEKMKDATTGKPHTAHTTGPVPCVLVHPEAAKLQVADGKLADIAPSVLTLLGLAAPATMTGNSLISEG